MNIEICKQCKELKYLQLRYRCNASYKYQYITRNYNAYKKCKPFNKIKESFVTFDTYFKYDCPDDCRYSGKRELDKCQKCVNFIIEMPRVKCRKCFSSNVYLHNLNKIRYMEDCDYKFEQEMMEMNKK